MDSIKPPPQTNYRAPERPPNESASVSPEDKGGVDLWSGALTICSYLAEKGGFSNPLLHLYCNSLNTVIWTKFDAESYTAPISPRYFTETQRQLCNNKVIEVFGNVMANYRDSPHHKNPHILCHTRYAIALEGKTFNQHCHNALSLSVEQWVLNKTKIEMGKPQGIGRKGRLEISHEFLQACFPLIPHVTELTISGHLKEKSRLLIAQEIVKMKNLSKLHFEVNKESAEYFVQILPNILKNLKIKDISLINYSGKVKKFAIVQQEIWDVLIKQNRCTIQFTNIPKQPDPPHNKLTFNPATG